MNVVVKNFDILFIKFSIDEQFDYEIKIAGVYFKFGRRL